MNCLSCGKSLRDSTPVVCSESCRQEYLALFDKVLQTSFQTPMSDKLRGEFEQMIENVRLAPVVGEEASL